MTRSNEVKVEYQPPTRMLTRDPETNPASLHLKMDGWKMSFLLRRHMFRGYVSFREGKCMIIFRDFLGCPYFLAIIMGPRKPVDAFIPNVTLTCI